MSASATPADGGSVAAARDGAGAAAVAAPPYVDGARLRALVSWEAAIDALHEGFAGDTLPASPLRTFVDAPAGELLSMPASGAQGSGVKLVTIAPGNPQRGLPLIHGVFVLFEPETLKPVAIIDGAALTTLRTPAVSALATRLLARPDARTLVVFGAGVQARAHVEAMCAVRPIETLIVVDPFPEAAERLARAARERGLDARVGDADDVALADLVCTCTTSTTPVFDSAALRPGAHVNAMGAYTPQMREVDERLVSRAAVFVEDREVALTEAGDLLLAIAAGAFRADAIHGDLSELCRGTVGRTDDEQLTLFKSVGMAAEDLLVACAAWRALDNA